MGFFINFDDVFLLFYLQEVCWHHQNTSLEITLDILMQIWRLLELNNQCVRYMCIFCVSTGERPFECDVCQKRFTLKHSMMRHRRKHVEPGVGSLSASDDENHHHIDTDHCVTATWKASSLQRVSYITLSPHAMTRRSIKQ